MYRFSILFLLLVAACNNTPQTSENTPSTQEASLEKAPAQEGIRYEGVLPTEDGDLLSTTIILGENNTYSLLQLTERKKENLAGTKRIRLFSSSAKMVKRAITR